MIELMVVIAIIAILTTLAAPSFVRLIQSNAMSGSVNTFMADLRFARSESIRIGGGVIMCRSEAPEAANATCGTGDGTAGNGWVSGWIVFHDKNGNGDRNFNIDPVVNDTLLRIQGPITALNSIMERGGGSSSTKFKFTATGRLLNVSSATTLQFGGNPTFSNDVQRVVCVSLGGRARIAGNGTTDCATSSE